MRASTDWNWEQRKYDRALMTPARSCSSGFFFFAVAHRLGNIITSFFMADPRITSLNRLCRRLQARVREFSVIGGVHPEIDTRYELAVECWIESLGGRGELFAC